MPSAPATSRPAVRRAAFWTFVVFLLAVLVALALTLSSVSAAARGVALVAVVPIVTLTVFLLFMERTDRRWSYGGAAVLGSIGVTLRLVISTRPSLEVGGGLPITVTIAYVGLGTALAVTSVWSFLSFRRV